MRQSAKTADWLVDNDVIWPVVRNCACANRDVLGRLFDLIYVTFSQSGGKTRRARSRFSSANYEVFRGRIKGKEIAFLQGNFDNVRFSENYCFAVHKGDAESLTDLIDRYLSLNSTQ